MQIKNAKLAHFRSQKPEAGMSSTDKLDHDLQPSTFSHSAFASPYAKASEEKKATVDKQPSTLNSLSAEAMAKVDQPSTFNHQPFLNLNLNLDPAKLVLLLGDSGCGKTSLLKAMAGFTDLEEGEIVSDNERVAMLLQNPFHQIIMQKVHDELYFPLKNGGIEDEDAEKMISEILEKLQISHLRDRDISTLSFGETQLVMIAATCLTPAEVLLLDEPTSHLDPPYIKRFYSLIRELTDGGKSICITSQSPDEYIFADEIWVMDKGNIKAVYSADKCPEAMKEAGIELDKDHIDEKLEGLKK